MLHWAAGSAINAPGETPTFRTDFYLSGTTFFTLGLGDVTPRTTLAKAITVTEGGTGFGFLGLMISYLPTLYGAFSQRELNISLLDARAGSPPTAAELLRRHSQFADSEVLTPYLRDWEIWAAQLMESHLSYPVLCYFRSQHDNQSWLAAFTAVLDVSALLIAYGEGTAKWQSQLTFAIARHAVVDLAEVLRVPASRPAQDRLPPKEVATGPQPSGGMSRLQQVRRIGRQKADRIARNVRTLFEWTFVAPADAASLLGRGTPFRGELETVGVGKNFFGACGLRRFEQRIQPFLMQRCGAGVSLVPMQEGPAFLQLRGVQKKIAGGTPALRKSPKNSD